MNTFLQVRMKKEVKEKFLQYAKESGSAGSTMVRQFVNDFINGHEINFDIERNEKYIHETIHNTGHHLKINMNDLVKTRVIAGRLHELTIIDLNDFMNEAIYLLVKYKVAIPENFHNDVRNEKYAPVFIGGMISQNLI